MTLNEHQYFDKSEKKVGKHKTVPDIYFDVNELKMGIEVEMEHTSDKKVAKEVAKDHLSEFCDYYSRLKKMEKKAEKHWRNKRNGNTGGGNGHSHSYRVNKKGNGLTILTNDGESHVHEIKNYVILPKENHIHVIT